MLVEKDIYLPKGINMTLSLSLDKDSPRDAGYSLCILNGDQTSFISACEYASPTTQQDLAMFQERIIQYHDLLVGTRNQLIERQSFYKEDTPGDLVQWTTLPPKHTRLSHGDYYSVVIDTPVDTPPQTSVVIANEDDDDPVVLLTGLPTVDALVKELDDVIAGFQEYCKIIVDFIKESQDLQQHIA